MKRLTKTEWEQKAKEHVALLYALRERIGELCVDNEHPREMTLVAINVCLEIAVGMSLEIYPKDKKSNALGLISGTINALISREDQ